MSIQLKDTQYKYILDWNETTSQLNVNEFSYGIWNAETQNYNMTLSDTYIISGGGTGGGGTSGSSGTSGTSGSSGVSGTNGTSGSSGTAGTSGTSGSSGINGTSGSSGSSGTAGTSGSSASNDPQVVDAMLLFLAVNT